MPFFLLPKIVRNTDVLLILTGFMESYNDHMSYINYNNNPYKKTVGDCVIRAISVAERKPWDDIYWDLAKKGFEMADLPSSNTVWSDYLKDKGYKRYIIPNTCPNCYMIKDFAKDHNVGTYVLGTGTHAVTVINGNIIDAWDSSRETPIYYFTKEE
jgi:hypothetical protein